MAVSVLASAATIALAAPEAQLVLYFMSLIYALTMRQIRLLFLAYGLLLLNVRSGLCLCAGAARPDSRSASSGTLLPCWSPFCVWPS